MSISGFASWQLVVHAFLPVANGFLLTFVTT